MSNQLPSRTTENTAKERGYRTSLPPLDYLKLEKEALERGLTPYKLTAIIMTMYVNNKLVPEPEQKENNH